MLPPKPHTLKLRLLTLKGLFTVFIGLLGLDMFYVMLLCLYLICNFCVFINLIC